MSEAAALLGTRAVGTQAVRDVLVFLPFFQCNNHEIRSGKQIGVCISVANNRLFVGSIPKSKTKEQIVDEFSKVTGKKNSSCVFAGRDDVTGVVMMFCCFQRASVMSYSTTNLTTKRRTEASASWSTKTTKRPPRLGAG